MKKLAWRIVASVGIFGLCAGHAWKVVSVLQFTFMVLLLMTVVVHGGVEADPS